MSLLERIVASKRAELAAGLACDHPPLLAEPFDVVRALRRRSPEPLRLMPEVKLRSPSAGELSRALDPAARAVAYARAGASLVSVLCDAPFFGGSFEDLARARRALDAAGLHVPLLAKEFVLEPVQLDWARAHGAAAVLLIARIVPAPRLAALVIAARERSLEPLVEVADEAELASAIAAGARIVGVNARDLDTLVIDTARAARVLGAIPPDHVAVHLSGIRTPEDVAVLARSRADAALVGEALMRAADPGPLLRAMVARA
jgi:indole-3-glycerol phosphate synthase